MEKILFLGILLFVGGCGSIGSNKELKVCQEKLKESEEKLMLCTLYFDDCMEPHDPESKEIKANTYHW